MGQLTATDPEWQCDMTFAGDLEWTDPAVQQALEHIYEFAEQIEGGADSFTIEPWNAQPGWWTMRLDTKDGRFIRWRINDINANIPLSDKLFSFTLSGEWLFREVEAIQEFRTSIVGLARDYIVSNISITWT
jgi:hypothetical protein